MNEDLAKIFYEMAIYLEMDDVLFKPQAYEKAAIGIESLNEDIRDIYKRGGIKELEKIPGVGKNISEKIEEFLKTGRIKEHLLLKKKIPVDLENLMKIEGIGPKKIKELYKKLKIKTVEDLEKAALEKKIRKLENFGEKSEKNILESIAFFKRNKDRFLLHQILPEVKEIVKKLISLKDVKKISIAGSLRRMKETIGDADILVVSDDPEKINEFFISLDGVVKVWGSGKTKSSVRMKRGYDIDLRVVPQKSFGSALQYFTGSKEHNILTRRIAIEKGLKLNEYGLFKGKKMIAGKDEREIYKALGMEYIEPELRENTGEIEAAIKNKLPKLVELKDIKGDLHCHSNWDGGADSILEIAKKAMSLNYEYVGIADHTKFLKIEHGLDERQLILRNKEIDKLNEKIKKENKNFKILKGCEANIMGDGSIDIKDEVLSQMDFVIAGIHSQFKMSKREMTERIIKAIKNPHVDIISHPTGRLINKRDEYLIDIDEIFKAAKETKTVLEINASPYRLDLKDVYIKKAKNEGIKMIINTDAHQLDQMDLMEYGLSQARRGWAEKEDIINTLSLEDIIKFLKEK